MYDEPFIHLMFYYVCRSPIFGSYFLTCLFNIVQGCATKNIIVETTWTKINIIQFI